MSDRPIEMRSDTMTRPTPEMREAIARADVGDDMSGEDPTVNRLEAMMAELLGKEAAVFACSGTQSNQMGVRIHCHAAEELLIEQFGHIANYEAGAPAALSGVSIKTSRSVSGSTASIRIIALPTACASSESPQDATMRAPSTRPCSSSLVNVSGGSSNALSKR